MKKNLFFPNIKLLNKIILRSKAKSYIVYWKKGKSDNNFIGVMHLWISYHKRGIKGRKYKYWESI
jgi:hypothetical protein